MAETVMERYRKALPGSWARWERACRVIPGGITHDSRHLTPFPLYVARAEGPRKWDVDGREYIDYWMGHGALFLGHSHPTLVEAVQRHATERAQRFVGRTMDVLVEGPSRTDPSKLRGRTRHNKTVNFTGVAVAGELADVEIASATSTTLAGEELLLARLG